MTDEERERFTRRQAVRKQIEAGDLTDITREDIWGFHWGNIYFGYRGDARYDASAMARFMWDNHPEWMKENGPKHHQQFSWMHLEAKRMHRERKEEKKGVKLTPAEAMRKSRAKHKDDPLHRFERLASRYAREGKLNALKVLYDNCPEGVHKMTHERVLRVLGRVEEADVIKKESDASIAEAMEALKRLSGR